MIDAGIILSSAYPNGHDRFISDCSLSEEQIREGKSPWMARFDKEKVAKDIMTKCKGKDYCAANFNILEYM